MRERSTVTFTKHKSKDAQKIFNNTKRTTQTRWKLISLHKRCNMTGAKTAAKTSVKGSLEQTPSTSEGET